MRKTQNIFSLSYHIPASFSRRYYPAHFEPPEFVLVLLGGITDAHPLVRDNFTAQAVILYPQVRAGEDTLFVKLFGNAQGFCQLAGTGGFGAGPDQNTLGVISVRSLSAKIEFFLLRIDGQGRLWGEWYAKVAFSANFLM